MNRLQSPGNALAVGYVAAATIFGWLLVLKLWPSGIGCEYQLYAHAAEGDFQWQHRQLEASAVPVEEQARYVWLYHDSLVVLWKPFAALGAAGMWAWLALMHVCYGMLIWRALDVKHGWLAVIATQKFFAPLLVGGNPAPALALLLSTAVGSGVVGVFKPHLAVVAVVLSAVRARRWSTRAPAGHGHADPVAASHRGAQAERPVGGGRARDRVPVRLAGAVAGVEGVRG